MQCGETLVGFQSSGNLVLNPKHKMNQRTWGEYDLLVLLCDASRNLTPADLDWKRLQRNAKLPESLLNEAIQSKHASEGKGPHTSVGEEKGELQ